MISSSRDLAVIDDLHAAWSWLSNLACAKRKCLSDISLSISLMFRHCACHCPYTSSAVDFSRLYSAFSVFRKTSLRSVTLTVLANSLRCLRTSKRANNFWWILSKLFSILVMLRWSSLRVDQRRCEDKWELNYHPSASNASRRHSL